VVTGERDGGLLLGFGTYPGARVTGVGATRRSVNSESGHVVLVAWHACADDPLTLQTIDFVFGCFRF
jgi:hypothetical protein